MAVEVARAFLLANHDGAQPSPDMRVHVFPVPHRFLTALPVVGHPTLDVAIEFRDTGQQRLPPVAWSHLLQPGFHSLHRLMREMDRPLLLFVPAKPEPKEVNFLRSPDRALFRVDE
jgi:hypothetical protein